VEKETTSVNQPSSERCARPLQFRISFSSVATMGDSPPPTPPPRAPNDRNEWRFKETISPCEWVEDYHPGGYHPVHLGNVFNNQYKVLRKLVEGSYSTVWLARDLKYVLPHFQVNMSAYSLLDKADMSP
jgi:hypothetical protein